MIAAMIIKLLPTVAKQGNVLGLFLKPCNAILVKLEKKIGNKLVSVILRWPGGAYRKAE